MTHSMSQGLKEVHLGLKVSAQFPSHGVCGETGWDLGPETLCCRACTWTNVSSSKKIQRNYKGLKITVCMHTFGANYGQQDTKRPKKPNCHF